MIRKIKIEDKNQYLKLAAEFYASPAVLHSVEEGNFSRTFDEVIGGSPYADCFILEADGRTAGYALTAKTFSQEAGGKVMWLEEIYILPEFRGKGLGREFIEHTERECRNAGYARLRLEVDDDNPRARKLYERLGFTPLEYDQMVKEL